MDGKLRGCIPHPYIFVEYIAKLTAPLPSVSIQLFNAMVVPILCYGSEIGGFSSDEEIELQFLKFTLRLPGNATNAAVRGELGQFPVNMFWKERILKYWCRVNTENIPFHLKLASLVQWSILMKDKQCWLLEAKHLYDTAGLSHKFYRAGTEPTKQHVNEVMVQFRDQFLQGWFEQLHSSEETTS